MARTRARKQLEDLAWKKTPRDYKLVVKGKRSVLTAGPSGTTLSRLDRLSEAELLKLAR